MYMIYVGNQAILDKPVTLAFLIDTFGHPEKLRKEGFKIVKVSE